MNDYRRKNGTGKSEDPKYHDTDDMNIYGMCTSTRCDAKLDDDHVPLPLLEYERLLPLRLVNLYFHYDLETSQNRTLRRYNPETTPVNE